MKNPDPRQLSIFFEVGDDLTWDEWFVALPVAPTAVSTVSPALTLPATSKRPDLAQKRRAA